MKKLVSFVSVAIIAVSIPVTVSATSNSFDGEVNMDELISQSPSGSKEIFNKENTKSMQTREAAGGGNFWVEWGGDRHTSHYDHSSKTHSASASNNRFTETSGWKSRGVHASAWVKSSVWGNKAFWNTK